MDKPADQLILVNSEDNPLGWLEKELCHDGTGQLHRAFSVFLFNQEGRLLIHQRSHGKRLWPGYWSNSCCSHPRWNEETHVAATRRVGEELGTIPSELEFAYKFQYHAQFGVLGSEHELCHVFLGRLGRDLAVDDQEVSDWQWVSAEKVDQLLLDEPDKLTPWFKMEWAHLRGHHQDLLTKYLQKERPAPILR